MHYSGIGATNEHARLIMESYQSLTGQPLLGEPASDSHPFEQLFNAPCVVLSHGTETDPVLNFGNRAALELMGNGLGQVHEHAVKTYRGTDGTGGAVGFSKNGRRTRLYR